MRTIYSILTVAIIAPLFFIAFKQKESSNLEKHQQLQKHYLKLMTEKELGLVHIELAKEYSKLYLRESGIIYVLTNGDNKNE